MRHEICIGENCNLREAVRCLHEGGYGVVFVLNPERKMVGILTDGDVRKAILRSVDLDKTSLCDVMNRNFTYVDVSETREAALNFLRKIQRRHLPILDHDGTLVDILLLDDIEFHREDTLVVIMAGGLGTRLAPLTDNYPKAMCKIGEKPLLELILNNFIYYGFSHFIFSVHYKANVIEEYFADGSKWGVEINYIHDPVRLGTAGALGVLKQKPNRPFIVMNGDLITNVDLRSLLEFHREHNSVATIAVSKYDTEVPYGVVEHSGHQITRIVEKPIHEFYVNAGIYVLEPSCLDYIPQSCYFDMTQLFDRLIEEKKALIAFPITEHWLDVGRMDDFLTARKDASEQTSVKKK